MSKIRIILNGKAAASAGVRDAVRAIRDDGHDVDVRVTWEAGDAARFTSDAIVLARAGKLDGIVAGGGDGTVNEVFSAAYAAGVPEGCSLAILPLGTANDFAHAAGVPIEDKTAALKLATTAPVRRIDLGLVDGRPFVNLASGGFGSRITVETDPELKRRLGGLAYVVTGLTRFPELAPSRGIFRGENFAWEGRFFAVAIGNGRQAGGGVPLCPDALIDDGLLDLTILPELERAKRLQAIPRLLKEGAASIRADLITARSTWFAYESEQELNVNLDGEPAVFRRFRVECAHRALPVRLGPSSLLS